jgi:hypothetical protein
MGEGIVTLTADTTNVGVTLMDYYTAGRDGAPYTSWISCENVPEQREPDKPIWCQA